MSTVLHFKPISEFTKERIEECHTLSGYECYLSLELFQEYNFNAKLKLVSPTVNFLTTPMILHAWTTTYFTGLMVKKETEINATQWASVTKIKQTSSIYWPEIQQSDIKEFGYCVILVIESLNETETHEFELEIEESN